MVKLNRRIFVAFRCKRVERVVVDFILTCQCRAFWIVRDWYRA